MNLQSNKTARESKNLFPRSFFQKYGYRYARSLNYFFACAFLLMLTYFVIARSPFTYFIFVLTFFIFVLLFIADDLSTPTSMVRKLILAYLRWRNIRLPSSVTGNENIVYSLHESAYFSRHRQTV